MSESLFETIISKLIETIPIIILFLGALWLFYGYIKSDTGYIAIGALVSFTAGIYFYYNPPNTRNPPNTHIELEPQDIVM